MVDDTVARLRLEYEAEGLVEEEMAEDPIAQFDEWFAGITGAGMAEPNTFVLATATLEGVPSARAVLMKEFGPEGLVFYTHLDSPKSEDLRANPAAAATFVWPALHRQVRFEGHISEVGAEMSDAYFARRPRGAQIAAHASHQSRPVANRQELDDKFATLETGFEGSDIPRPVSWGGWRLEIESVEFWQGQPNRFHDRVKYHRVGSGWSKERLAP